MKNITVILPVHKLDEAYSLMLQNAVNSVENFYNDVVLMIVCPSSVKKEIDKINLSQKLEIKYQINDGNINFCAQVNLGIKNCDTEWFSILEIDDEYKSAWLKSVSEWKNAYPDVSVFLPVVTDINSEGNFISFTNESVWAYGFSEKQGFLDNEILLDFQNYQISGGLYKTSVIIENGMLKDNIKLTFGYEFLLRLTYNKVNIMTVPKIGYQHTTFREDSLFWCYKNSDENKLSEKEASFWLDVAKKEFFFTNKREVNYVEN
jgi:hypothetical protein